MPYLPIGLINSMISKYSSSNGNSSSSDENDNDPDDNDNDNNNNNNNDVNDAYKEMYCKK